MIPPLKPITVGAITSSVRTREIGGFVLTDLTHPPNQIIARHFHENASLVFYVTGSVSQRFGNRTLECGASNVIIKPPHETHSDFYGSNSSRKLAIEINSSRLKSLLPFAKALEEVRVVQRGVLPSLATRIYHEFTEGDSASSLAIEGLILESVAEISRCNHRAPGYHAPPWLKRAKDILHAHFSDGGVRLSTVADSVGVHPVHLARQFRRFYGVGVGEYFRNLRIEHARNLLSTSNLPLVRIAAELGFSDHAHFSRAFKQRFGLTPTQYRALLRSR